MQEILLTRGKVAIVDDDDFIRLLKYKWHCNNSGYAARRGKKDEKALVLLHHEVLGIPQNGLEIDHINRNRLDNRKCNLRFVSRTQNCANRAKTTNKTSSVYKGVYFEKDSACWKSVIEINGRKRTLGRFKSETEAAQTYNMAALSFFGKYANLNLI